MRADGRPHVAPIWFGLDGVSLCIDYDEPPFHFVMIEGTAELTSGDPDLLYRATRLGGCYMGAERAGHAAGGCRP